MLQSWFKRLRGRTPLRPPGALFPDILFEQACIRCRRCVEICPYDSIQTAHGDRGLEMGLPYIEPREIPCYLCMKCPPVCPTGALQLVTDQRQVKMGLAVIDKDRCLAYNGVICRACYERCPIYREAIVLKDELYPVVMADKCVGCGICENVCPADPAAITVVSYSDLNDSRKRAK